MSSNRTYLNDEDLKSIIESIDEDTIEYLCSIDSSEIISLHHTLGTHIRNLLGLWVKYENSEIHPDDVSYHMMLELQNNLKEKKNAVPRSIPCGNCDCGTYSDEAALNKKARKFGALDEEERFLAIPMCKVDKDLKCAGADDFHKALISLDRMIDNRKEAIYEHSDICRGKRSKYVLEEQK